MRALATIARETLGRALRAVRRRDILLAAGLLIVGVAVWLHAASPGYDFFGAYLTGARAVASGTNPYTPLMHQITDTRAGTQGLHPLNGYVYPPLLATLLALPVRLGLAANAAWLLWNLTGAAALIWMARELNLALRGRTDLAGTLAFAVATLLSALATFDLTLGQADLLIAALTVGACCLLVRGSPGAGIALGVSIALKPIAVLLLLVWLWKGNWRATIHAVLVAGALVLAPFTLLGLGTGLGSLHDYLTFLFGWTGLRADAQYNNQSLYAMLLRTLSQNIYTRPLVDAPWLIQPLRLLLLGGALAWYARAVPRARPADSARAIGEYLLALPLVLIGMPYAENIHYCLLIPALVGLSFFAWQRARPPSAAAWILWVAMLVCYIPFVQDLPYPGHPLPGESASSLGPILALVRSGTLLYVAVAALLAGGAVLRDARSDGQPSAGLAVPVALTATENASA